MAGIAVHVLFYTTGPFKVKKFLIFIRFFFAPTCLERLGVVEQSSRAVFTKLNNYEIFVLKIIIPRFS